MTFWNKPKKYLLLLVPFLVLNLFVYNKVEANYPTVDIYLSSNIVKADNTTQYNIAVNGYSLGGASYINEMYALINEDGDNSGTYRGYFAWDSTVNAWAGEQDNMGCSLNGTPAPAGGYAAIISVPPGFGNEYIHLDQCDVSDFSDGRTIDYKVRFDPLFFTDGPLTNNDIAGKIKDDYSDEFSGWINSDLNFEVESYSPPNPPVITGPTSGNPGVNYTYTFTGTDPQDYQIRYGIDWDMDGTADEWLPSGLNYVNSGVGKSTNHSWATTGNKTFQALTQSSWGVNSSWGNYDVTISSNPVDGVCGTANRVYPNGDTSYGTDTYCALGNPSSSPPFPPSGGSANWTCLGTDGGADSPQCTASVTGGVYSLTVIQSIVFGGKIMSLDGQINCGANCSASYSSGDNVTLMAIPNLSYWKFTGWSGDCSGTGSCMLDIDGDKSVSATFVPRIFNFGEF